MKKILLILCTIMFALSACEPENNVVETKHYDHTLFIYMPWSGGDGNSTGSLLRYFRQNIAGVKNAITAGQGSGTTRVMLLLASSSSSATLSELYFTGDSCAERRVKTYSNWSFSTSGNIKHIFNDVASYSPTSSYSMIIGSHGTGWIPKTTRAGVSRAFGGQSATVQVDVEQLDSVVTQSNIRKLNFVCFDDCYMANIETAYALRNCANYLIASTSEVMGYGLPYELEFPQMRLASPNYNTIVNIFHTFYTSYRFPYGALSVIDLRDFSDAVVLMKDLNDAMTANGISPTDVSPQVLDGYSTTRFFDMEDYTSKVVALLPTPNTFATRFADMYQKLVVAHSCTPQLYTTLSGSRAFNVATNCGLTISDPSTATIVVNNLPYTEWYQDTH